jgi:hypothetical protein
VAQLVKAMRYKPGSIPSGVIGIFHWHILPNLESTQPLTEINYFFRVKAAVASGWLPYHVMCYSPDLCRDCFAKN